MTPHAVTVETLMAHELREGYDLAEQRPVFDCRCGWVTTARSLLAARKFHSAHQADMLVAAGVTPTVQEWGVKYAGSGGSTLIYRDTNEAGARSFLASVEFHGRPGMVVTRWTGATEWAPA